MNLTDCPSLERLQAGLEGSAEGPVVAAHVESCSSCQARLETLAAGNSEVDELLHEAGRTPIVPFPPLAVEDLAPRLTSGMRLGEYRLEQPLGEGGMGAVWRAVHTRLEKQVAVKVLNRRLSNQSDAIARFSREMKAIGRLEHPNIVSALDAGEADRVPFLVMEFIDGFDLGNLVKRLGPMKTADACEAVRQAAIGLQHAHEHGMVHRDVKPGNLMLASDGSVKLLDLGLARLPGATDTALATADTTDCVAADLTDTNMLVGTSSYMAPEQRRDPRSVDSRADVFALGRTLCFLLTGVPELPTAGKVPVGLTRVLQRMLSEDANERYPTAANVAEALGPWRRGHELGALVGLKPSKRKRAGHAVLAAIAIGIIAVGITIGISLSGHGDTPQQDFEPEVIRPLVVMQKEPPRSGVLGMSADEMATLQKDHADFLETTPIIENSVEMKFALVPPGEFNLTQKTRVKLTKPYWLATTEVTRGQFQRFVESRGHRTEVEVNGNAFYHVYVKQSKNSGGTRVRKDANYSWRTPGYKDVTNDDPVTQVSWNDAVAFCRWLSDIESKTYRLPTRSEMAWAARAGESGDFPGSHPDGDLVRSLELFAHTSQTSPTRPQPVARLKSNAWGLFDMLGNVGEWTNDWWGEDPVGVFANYQGPLSGTLRGAYGGAYTVRLGFDGFTAMFPEGGNSAIGFRVLREP